MTRGDVYRSVNDLLGSISSGQTNASLEYENNKLFDAIILKTQAYKFNVKIFKEPIDRPYFNADTLVTLQDKTYAFRSSEVDFEYAKNEIKQIANIIDSVLSDDFKIVFQRELFFLKNEYLVTNPKSENDNFLLRVN